MEAMTILDREILEDSHTDSHTVTHGGEKGLPGNTRKPLPSLGEPSGNRTPNLLIKSQLLYQLS
jgi:hypothetical protein